MLSPHHAQKNYMFLQFQSVLARGEIELGTLIKNDQLGRPNYATAIREKANEVQTILRDWGAAA